MNSLEDVLEGIERRIKMIYLAYQLGFNSFDYKGELCLITKNDKTIEIHGTTLKLVLDLAWFNLKNIAKNFDFFWTVSEEAKKVLERELKKFEEDKEILGMFLLQEKVSPEE